MLFLQKKALIPTVDLVIAVAQKFLTRQLVGVSRTADLLMDTREISADKKCPPAASRWSRRGREYFNIGLNGGR